jgi:hypothetical protein
MLPRFKALEEPRPDPSRVTVLAFLRSLDFRDLLVLLGFAALVIAGWYFHISIGIGILGAGLMLVGVRAGRIA